jgi:alkanesulfonate monooxygenase SsuD/methylene tetrahydromethanopterin reductase-like flavin-dependent oxidoreductase (luciferase family)
VILPAIAEGAARSGRTLSDIDLLGAPFLAIGRDEEGVEKARNALRQNVSFYASTRSYHSVLEFHGWQDVGTELHKLSVAGKWAEMPALISDDMLDEWAVVATYDDFADKLEARAEGLFNTVLLALPGEARSNVDWLRETLQRLH